MNLRIKYSIDRLINLIDLNPNKKNRIKCLLLLLNEWIKLGNKIDRRINLGYCCKVNSFELAVFAHARNNDFIESVDIIKKSLDIAFEKGNDNLIIFITSLNWYQLTVDDYFRISSKCIDIADDLLKKSNICANIRTEALKRLNLLQKTEKILNSDEIQMIDICQKTINKIESFDEFKKIIATNVINKLNEKFKVNLDNIKIDDIIKIDWEKPWGFNYMINNTYRGVDIIVKEIFNTDSNNAIFINNVNNNCCLQ